MGSHSSERVLRAVAFAVETLELRRLLTASFEAAADYATGTQPSGIVVADLNGDARPDVATADFNAQAISVRFGNADGTFSARSIFPTSTGIQPTHVLAGDVDGDADVDLIAITEVGLYSVFRNSPGSGGFADFTRLANVVTGETAADAELLDMNDDGKLDLVLYGSFPPNGQLIEAAVGARIYIGQGDGTFATTPTTTAIAQVAIFAGSSISADGFALADFDGNGEPDVVAASTIPGFTLTASSILSIAKNPLGAVANSTLNLTFQPSSIATGDFNGDAKPDLVISGSRQGLIGTQQRLQIFLNDGSGGFMAGVDIATPANFTRIVKAADIDGDGNLDVVSIAGDRLLVLQGKGDGTFATTSTSLATNAFPIAIGLGDFNGDSKVDAAVASYNEGNFAIHLNNSTPGLPSGGGGGPQPTTPALSATLDRVTLPDVFVPGDKGSAQVVIANAGGLAKGKVNVALYASLDGTLDGADTLLDTGSTLADKSVNIRTDRTARLTGRFVVPAALANGEYFLLAKVTPVDITGATEVTGVSAETAEKVTAFGNVGDRRNVKYTSTDADGTLVTYALSGPGTGTVSDDGTVVTLDGTTTASKFTATTKAVRATAGSDDETSVADLTVNGPIASIAGKGLQITNSLTVGDVKTIALEDLIGTTADVAVTLGGSIPVAITLDDVHDAIITSTAPIKSLKLDEWFDLGFANDSITAPWIGTVAAQEDLAVAFNLSGWRRRARGLALSSVKVGENLAAKVWAVGGNVGTITVTGSVPSGWIGNFAGNLKTMTTKGNFTGGSLAAANIGTFAVTGAVSDSTVRAGWGFGPDNAVATGDDTQAVGIITRLAIKTSLASSIIWAGADADGDPIDGGQIKAISPIGAVAPTGVAFVASIFPRTVRFDGETFVVADDPRFTSFAF